MTVPKKRTATKPDPSSVPDAEGTPVELHERASARVTTVIANGGTEADATVIPTPDDEDREDREAWERLGNPFAGLTAWQVRNAAANGGFEAPKRWTTLPNGTELREMREAVGLSPLYVAKLFGFPTEAHVLDIEAGIASLSFETVTDPPEVTAAGVLRIVNLLALVGRMNGAGTPAAKEAL